RSNPTYNIACGPPFVYRGRVEFPSTGGPLSSDSVAPVSSGYERSLRPCLEPASAPRSAGGHSETSSEELPVQGIDVVDEPLDPVARNDVVAAGATQRRA